MTLRLDRPGHALPAGELRLEEGGTRRVGGRAPQDLPPGYHQLQPDDGPAIRLIVSPGRAPLPPERMWGFAAQLYAARSERSWGMGDLGDLLQLGAWSTSLGAGLVAINPLHAASPVGRQEASPYFPSSRCFLNPLYLAVDQLPDIAGRPAVAEAAAAGRDLNRARLIDRDRVWVLKARALEDLYAGFTGDPAFDAYIEGRGLQLQHYATYCLLAEQHGPCWPDWPAEFQRPTSPGTVRAAATPEGQHRIRYHQWLQWHLEEQLRNAADRASVMQDLAVGVDPAGADTWMWPDVFAPGMQVGAPPDRYNQRGQDWAVPAFDPWRLRAAGHEPFIQSLRGVLRHSAGLRIDHVMGLFRLYWIPVGEPPAHGAYVRYPHDELLDIVTLEAQRAGAFIVGEDLGTVEAGVRSQLADRNLLSYKVWWFERQPPEKWPVAALGAVTTHDLPTVAGVWSGHDPDQAGTDGMRRRTRRWTGVQPEAPEAEVIDETYARLSRAPCVLLTATLDDAVAVEERPNLPGTLEEWPNWRLALPYSLEEIEGMALPRAIADRLSRRATP
jgi:4-alpha-glucanotransferase